MKIYSGYDAVRPGTILVKWNRNVEPLGCGKIIHAKKPMVVVGETEGNYLVALPGRGWPDDLLERRILDMYGVNVGREFYHVRKEYVIATMRHCPMTL